MFTEEFSYEFWYFATLSTPIHKPREIFMQKQLNVSNVNTYPEIDVDCWPQYYHKYLQRHQERRHQAPSLNSDTFICCLYFYSTWTSNTQEMFRSKMGFNTDVSPEKRKHMFTV